MIIHQSVYQFVVQLLEALLLLQTSINLLLNVLLLLLEFSFVAGLNLLQSLFM